MSVQKDSIVSRIYCTAGSFSFQMLICGYDELDSAEEAEITKKKDKDAKYKWNHGS